MSGHLHSGLSQYEYQAREAFRAFYGLLPLDDEAWYHLTESDRDRWRLAATAVRNDVKTNPRF